MEYRYIGFGALLLGFHPCCVRVASLLCAYTSSGPKCSWDLWVQDLKSGNVLLTGDGHAKIADVVRVTTSVATV